MTARSLASPPAEIAPAPARSQTADRAGRLVPAVAYTILPVASVYSTRSAITFLALATLIAWLSLLWGARSLRPLEDLGALARHASTRFALALVCLAAASALWSIDPAETLEQSAKLLLALVALTMWVAAQRRRTWDALPWLLAGLTLAEFGLLWEFYGEPSVMLLATGEQLPRFAYNRSMVVICVLAVCAAFLAARERGARTAWAGVTLLGAAGLAMVSDSQASQLFLVVCAIAAAIGIVSRDILVATVFLAVAAGLALFPLVAAQMGLLLEQASDTPAEVWFDQGSGAERTRIWAGYASAVLDRPWLGWGFGTERFVPLPPGTGEWGSGFAWHPHNISLQVLINEGILGLALFAGAMATLLDACRRMPLRRSGATLVMALGLFTIWMISHGAWQEWYLAVMALALSTLAFSPSMREPDEFDEEHRHPSPRDRDRPPRGSF